MDSKMDEVINLKKKVNASRRVFRDGIALSVFAIMLLVLGALKGFNFGYIVFAAAFIGGHLILLCMTWLWLSYGERYIPGWVHRWLLSHSDGS